MRKIRNCTAGLLNTGSSKCPIEYKHIKGAIVVEHGITLPDTLDSQTLEEKCHADRPDRLYPISTFVEYSKDGGTPQVSAVGYGGNQVSSYNARTDTFTLEKYSEQLAAQISRVMNAKFDVFYWDEHNRIYGVRGNDGSLHGFPMSTIYPDATPHPTSGDVATLTVNFCHSDAQLSIEKFDFIELDFDPSEFAIGLTEVELLKTGDGDNKYKLVEKIGGYDLTERYGQQLADKATTALVGATSCTYDEEAKVLTIVPAASAKPALAKASVLYTNKIVGIEAV